MNDYLPFNRVELWQIAGWTMLHYLWLGSLVAAVAAMSGLVLRRASPNTRYAAALCWLMLLALLPIGIAAWLNENVASDQVAVTTRLPNGAAPAAFLDSVEKVAEVNTTDQRLIELSEPSTALSPVAQSAEIKAVVEPQTTLESSPAPLSARNEIVLATLESCVPYLPWLWIVGTPLTFALLAAGIVGTKRLQRASRAIDEPRITEILSRLADSLRVTRRVSVAVCERIAAPVLIGIVRPIILLPPAALTGWSPEEIEMVLLHELAHVRRWDNLINLAQRIIESLLFFHPAVWLVSNWARREREACCDALVVTRTKRPHAYAELLVALATQMPRSVLFHPAASSAMAAGPLRNRIRRILGLEDDPMLISGKSFALMVATLLVAATLALLYLPNIGQAEESTTEATDSTDSIELPAKADESGTAPKESTEATGEPLNFASDEIIPDLDGSVLDDAVDTFNVRASKDAVGKTQPPLTAEEVVTAIRAWDRNSTPALDVVYKAYQRIAERGVLPPGATLDYTTGWRANSGYDIDVWCIDLSIPTDPNSGYTFRIRDTKLGSRPSPDNQGRVNAGDPRPASPYREADRNREKPDDWPKGITFPSPKEGEISKRAWESLRIKVIPATETEQRAGGRALKLTGVQVAAHESRGPVFLDRIDEFQIDDFDDLALALDKTKGKELIVVECIVTTDRGPGRFEFAMKSVAAEPRGVSPPERTIGQSKKFPSLEDQKLADLVWKRLGLEMEPIGEEDLKRVRTLGYDGGLLVRGNPGRVAKSGADQTGDSILTDDILVGLHVWPTTSMEEVVEVLNRTDLAELNPLKFYVVSNVAVGVTEDDQQIMGDVVRTGRISVVVNEGGFGGGRSATRSQQASPAAAAASNPYAARAKPTPAPDPDLPRYELPLPEVEAATPSRSQSADLDPFAQVGRSKRSGAARAVSRPGDAASKSNSRYDGKTFDEWHTAWQTELSTEKRMEAVKALAAFGRAGYGKEATEAILDVAGQYDFQMIDDDTVEGKLKETILDELADPSYPTSQPLAEHWLPVLATRIEKEPKKWRWLAANLLRRLQTNDEKAIAILQSLAESGPGEVRGPAIGALTLSRPWRSDGSHIDDKTRDLFVRALKSNDKATVRSAIQVLPQFRFQAELMPLLFHADEEIRGEARGVLRSIDNKDAPPVVRQLLAVLDDDSRKPDHLHAIHGLAAMLQRSREAIPSLKRVLKHSDDRELLLAALAAVWRIESGTIAPVPYGEMFDTTMNQVFTDEELSAVKQKLGYADSEDSTEFMQAFWQAANAVYPLDNQGFGGGGGFF